MPIKLDSELISKITGQPVVNNNFTNNENELEIISGEINIEESDAKSVVPPPVSAAPFVNADQSSGNPSTSKPVAPSNTSPFPSTNSPPEMSQEELERFINKVQKTSSLSPVVFEPAKNESTPSSSTNDSQIMSSPSNKTTNDENKFNDPAPAAKTIAKPPEELSTTGPYICKHCGWPSDVPADPDPSDEDRLAFIASLCAQLTGDKTASFQKIYSIFNDKLKIAFRDLTISELDAIAVQVLNDYRSGEIKNQLDELEKRLRYRTALHIMWIEVDGKRREFITHMDEIELPPNVSRKEVLKYYLKYIETEVMCTESLCSIIKQLSSQFNRLCAKLQITWDKSVDFLSGVEKQY